MKPHVLIIQGEHMNRTEIIREKINNILNTMVDENNRNIFYVHLYGVSSFAALLAARRGADTELAFVAGLLHDVSLLSSNDYENHCKDSAKMAKEFLLETSLFSDEEINIITDAILHHNDLDLIHTLYDEILKDSDVLQPFFNDIPEPAFPPAIPRLKRIM
jgi:HD superfamily phosphodiesterase